MATAPSTSSAASAIDRENPWPGLASFTEDASGFFFGREKETDELSRLVRRQTLTVLFGQSGLGKSSLIQAGLFPLLRAGDLLPLYLRLDHAASTPPLAEQVKTALTAAFAAEKADAPAFRADETLWEYFHRKDVDIWSAKNRLLTPVLAFDQFEEIFTLGRADDACSERSRTFLAELACLVENRPPAAVQEKLDRGELDPARFNYAKPSCQVILSLREDFLPDLEGLKREMPALIHNRLRLKKLSGTQALDIVTKPAPHLLAEGVAEKIVEFVAGARGGSAERLAELDVEPPLLSVICRELNDRRRALGQTQITADLVSGNRREILHDFYERSVADLPAPMRAFIEDHLLTKSGFRDNLALETALEFPGVTRPLLDTLVARRLLRIEDRLGVPRVELTHDVLAEVIRAARDERQQQAALAASARQARRQRTVIAGLAAAVFGLLVGAFFGIRAQRRAERAAHDEAVQSSHTDFIFGSQLLEQGKVLEGLGYLVRAARSDPENSTISPRLLSALAFRSFAVPTGVAIPHPSPVVSVGYIGDGQRLLTLGQDSLVRVWETQTGKNLLTINAGKFGRFGEDVTLDGQRLGTATDDGVSIWDLATGRKLLGPLRHGQAATQIAFSPDGRWLATNGRDNVTDLWDTTTGELKCTLPLPHDVRFSSFSRDSRLLLTVAFQQREWRIWQVPEGAPVFPVQMSPRNVTAGIFSPDGRLILMGGEAGEQMYDATTGEAVGTPLAHLGPSYAAAFTHDGKIAVTTSDDGSARVWEVPSGKLRFNLPHNARVQHPVISPDDRYLITKSLDGLARIWDLHTGRLALEPIRTGDVQEVEMASDGHELLTSGTDNVVRRWRIESGAAAPLQMAPAPERLRVQRSLTGSSEAWLIYADRLELIDVLTGKPRAAPRAFPVRIRTGLLASNDQAMLVTTGSGDNELWRFSGPEIVRHLLGNFPVNRSSFSSNSSRLAINGPSDVVRVWDCVCGALVVGPLPNTRLPTFGNALSPDGRKLLVYRQGEFSVHVIDLGSGQIVGEPLDTGAPISGLSFSPDSKLVALASQDSTVRFWDAETTRQVGPTLLHRDWARGVVFSRDGRRLLTFTPLHARVWDVATGAPITESILAGNDLFNGIFSDDGAMFATRTRASGEIRLWDSQSGEPLAEPLTSAPGGTVNSFGFIGSDRFMAVATSGGAFSVTPIPPKSRQPRIPNWLPRLASVVAGGEIDRRGVFRDQVVDATAYDELRRELAALPDDAPYVTWGRWFLADRATRAIGPGFTLTTTDAEK